MSKVRRAGRGRAVRPDPSMGKASERSSLVIVPLTDRILAITPGPRWIWIVLWSLLAIPLTFFLQRLIQAVEPSSQALAGGLPGPWFSAAIVNATLLSLWGSRKLAVDTVRTEAAISRLILDERLDAGRPIRGMDSLVGPLALTFVLVGLDAALTGLDFGWRIALVTFPISFVIELPLLTFFWTYASLLVGLNRLGRHKLRLDDTPGDRTLGLRPVGHLAFSGFWIFSVGFAPILILTATSTPTLVLNLVFFLIGFALFVLSLNRLHQQLVEAKRTHLELARQLYAEAYAPLVRSPNVRTLQAQTSLLSAAESLEKRSAGIQEWPFDEVLPGRIAIIVSTVVATVMARIILDAIGL